MVSPATVTTNLEVGILLLLIVVILLLLSLLVARAQKPTTWPKNERSWLDYGNLFIVSFGIVAVTVGFLIMLLFIDQFTDRSKALAFLVALFGVITGLVGTYFGVKQSADAREGAQDLAEERSGGAGTTTPIITIEPPTDKKDVEAQHKVIATVTNADKSKAANVAVTFTVTEGPDKNTRGESKTGEHGRAIWSFTNNGKPGKDTIKAKALEATGTATVEFEERPGGSRGQEQAEQKTPDANDKKNPERKEQTAKAGETIKRKQAERGRQQRERHRQQR